MSCISKELGLTSLQSRIPKKMTSTFSMVKRFECPSWRAKGDNMLVLGAHVQPHCLHHLRWRSIHGGPRLSFLNGVWLEQPLKLQEPFKELAGGAITQKVYFWTTQTKKWSLTRSQFYYYFNPANKKMYKIVFPYRQSTRANLSVLLMALKVLQLPYNRGNEIWRSLSLYIYLPNAKDGLESLLERMCSEHGFLDKYVPSKYITLGEFKIPKFKIRYEL